MPHSIDLAADHVVKHFAPDERGAHRRELLALTLLAEHAPGLAPEPLPKPLPLPNPLPLPLPKPEPLPLPNPLPLPLPLPDGTDPAPGAPSSLRMSRLPGEPLRGMRLDGRRTAALAVAVGTLFDAVPPEAVAQLPPRPDALDHVTAYLRTWAPHGPRGDDPLVAEAAAAGLAWLGSADLAQLPGLRPVFGPGDGNLANYLWDGTRVRVVDFESCGRSDRAYELAEIAEHVSAWSAADAGTKTTGTAASAQDTALDVDAFLAHFDLTPAEEARLADCRRLLALVWLFRLSQDDPANPRNAPDTPHRQALRLLQRLR